MTDMRMPSIIYGTAWKKERTTSLVTTALATGFRGIDTACQPKHYREDLVGAALPTTAFARETLYIQTKYTSIGGQDRRQPLPYDPAAPITQQVQSSIATSLSNLNTTYLDSVLLHSPLRTRDATLEAWRALEAFVDEGKIKALGISNVYEAEELAWLLGEARVRVGVVQNRWHEGNGWDWDVYDLCQRHGIAYQSFWTLTGSPSLLGSAPVTALSERYDLTPEQVVYRLCHLWNITPLCGSTNEEHMAEALLAVRDDGGLFGKDEQEVGVLWRVMRGEE